MRVLLIEDDPMIGKALRLALKGAGMAADWVRDGADGQVALKGHSYAVILLDIGLPGCNGLDLLKDVRAVGDETPVIMITARDELDDRVDTLDRGADDYLIKPFAMTELLARMRAVMRRRHGGQAESIIRNGPLQLDLSSHTVTYMTVSHVLSAREFALVRILMERPGTIFSRQQLEEHLYGWGEEVESNAVDVLIHYVRRKFGKSIIRNVRGAGWTIDKSSR